LAYYRTSGDRRFIEEILKKLYPTIARFDITPAARARSAWVKRAFREGEINMLIKFSSDTILRKH
jgi:hypothetical protein